MFAFSLAYLHYTPKNVQWFFYPYHKDNQEAFQEGSAFRNKLQLVTFLHKDKYTEALQVVSAKRGFSEVPAPGSQDYISLTQTAAKAAFNNLSLEEQKNVENLRLLWNRVGRDLHDILEP